MRGVSEVIAIVLILMITIAIAGLAYTFMSDTLSSTTAATSSSIDTTASTMLTSFIIESMDVSKAYIRNTGNTELYNLSVYIDDEPARFNLTPDAIISGQVGTVTIYSFIPDGATIKVTSPNGFSTSKEANPCTKAVGCWKFDENGGTVAYDSSKHLNHGILTNGPVWTSRGLSFDGTNDYVRADNAWSYNSSRLDSSTWEVRFNMNSLPPSGTQYKVIGALNYHDMSIYVANNGLVGFRHQSNIVINSGYYATAGEWVHFIASVKYLSSNQVEFNFAVNGQESRVVSTNANLNVTTSYPGYIFGSNQIYVGAFFNGTIDEVRVYNRAIY